MSPVVSQAPCPLLLHTCTVVLPRCPQVLYIVRNPFDSVVAERKRILTYGERRIHHGVPPWETFWNGTTDKDAVERLQLA